MRRAIIAALSAAMLVAVTQTASAAPKCGSSLKICKSVNQVTTKHTRSNVKGFAQVRSTSKIHKLSSKRTYVARRKNQSRQVAVLPAARQRVVALVKSMAPAYGVPTWFALRIAKVESGFNPRARGRAGEYGVFQLKCGTARMIGFHGNCRSLLDASTNIRFGLKHLSMALKSSRGNLRLAASKHNGGLGRKRLVRSYVNRVF